MEGKSTHYFRGGHSEYSFAYCIIRCRLSLNLQRPRFFFLTLAAFFSHPSSSRGMKRVAGCGRAPARDCHLDAVLLEEGLPVHSPPPPERGRELLPSSVPVAGFHYRRRPRLRCAPVLPRRCCSLERQQQVENQDRADRHQKNRDLDADSGAEPPPRRRRSRPSIRITSVSFCGVRRHGLLRGRPAVGKGADPRPLLVNIPRGRVRGQPDKKVLRDRRRHSEKRENNNRAVKGGLLYYEIVKRVGLIEKRRFSQRAY